MMIYQTKPMQIILMLVHMLLYNFKLAWWMLPFLVLFLSFSCSRTVQSSVPHFPLPMLLPRQEWPIHILARLPVHSINYGRPNREMAQWANRWGVALTSRKRVGSFQNKDTATRQHWSFQQSRPRQFVPKCAIWIRCGTTTKWKHRLTATNRRMDNAQNSKVR